VSVFLETNHLFLRNPRGGVEDIQNMKNNGFGVVFCNIKDYAPEEWDLVRERAQAAGVPCGPWGRTATDSNEFDPNVLTKIQEVAEAWGDTPYIVNSESEINGTGSDITSYIQKMCGADDWALSMEPWPFANVDWSPIKAPVLPQCFGPDWGSPEKEADCTWEWHRVGLNCVVPTYGTYNQWQPAVYNLFSPYGLYTADDCANEFAKWAAKGSHEPCTSTPPPTNGGSVAGDIGNQDGIKAAMNRLRTLDPAGTLLVRDASGSWPDISTLPSDVNQWKAYDKLQRTLQILKDDHGAAA